MAASHAPYPSFSMECVSDILRLVRGRTVRDELPLFAKCLYSLTGSLLAVTVGEPGDGPFAASSLSEVDTDALAECKTALETVVDDGAVYGAAGDEAEKLDPALVSLLVTMALKLIQAWVEKRRNQ